ncbi:hypothetical protein EMIHUDRAFT_371478 [Emiliania huxleyi CCMP1516]|uniref:Tafazzin family protein n=2 Tax=Emiliania huxleyi TaxID=2903 RepID=A0A0D3IAN8_EMIH1|nr:hypothetical protein EMIHUDRAFT_438292 [Emiliania huxleyi CCMP1516]XP_005764107.1 hypothetical protein EMIHUDRAFT_371478 [Emiliania huxleyi CCMP1516]EOD08323.1 hypothetical protein EMIHUDRAFT_438292 [Emiliania huxleyi CCMP1516]EOD11678.1 hypothetical protein EMIHUDRAFT_371478 [Emiliania huxleyi CCMP1516]|eukprot:XP_005760752.1 hypothetical protein EMIHUDRAFT_438292 [Emiliania huxleyi CCMP1516]
MLDAPRAILRCWGWRLDGSLPAPVGTPGKYRLDALLPIAALPWSSTGGHDGIPPYSQLRPPARGVASAVVCGPAALRRGGARWSSRVSEQLQAATVRLHEDVLRMSGALEGLDLLRAEALGAARRPSEPRPAWVERALAAERSAAAASSGA